MRKQRFTAASKEEAAAWQKQCREKLFELMMGVGKLESIPLSPQILRREEMPAGGYRLQEITLASLPDRRLHAWVTLPNSKNGQAGAVLALHGHGGSGEQVVRGEGLYWYGRALAEMGYIVISPDIGQHELQHPDWSLMGERVWDSIRCIDYLLTLPEVDKSRIAVAGLSLGGETAMYVAALDERVKAACSSGWLTTIENMKQGHCPCWNFPGLEEHFDFADIFALIAPRPLVLEIGEKEKAPGGFPVEIARQAFAEIQPAYSIFGAQDDLVLDIHSGGHVFHGAYFWGPLHKALARVYCLTREPKYLKWAERIGDAYCFEILPRNGGLPPHRWDFATHKPTTDTLNLNDHGNEIIGGLAELYVVTKAFHPEKAGRYLEPLSRMFHRLLERARNADGLWFNLLRASTAEVLRAETPDTWGYALSAGVTFGRAAGDEALVDAAKLALKNIDRPQYLDWNGADSYADSIEGALYLLNRFPIAEGFDWLDKILPLFLGKQRDDGIVEGWYGDGNYARTAFLAGLYYTQGVIPRPWRHDLTLGALSSGKSLQIMGWTDGPWEGKICFDTRRHQRHLRLPTNYPRLNEFPEWFTVEEDANYHVRLNNGKIELKTGKELIEGHPVRLDRPGFFHILVEPH
jgi:hypothetical protein